MGQIMNAVEALERYRRDLLCDEKKYSLAILLEYTRVFNKIYRKKKSHIREIELKLLEIILEYDSSDHKNGVCDSDRRCDDCEKCERVTDLLTEIYYRKHKERIESDIKKHEEENSVNR